MNKFSNIDLCQPLDAGFLSTLDLNDLNRLRKNLVERAAAVIGEISSLEHRDDFAKKQYARGMFNSRIENDGKVLFNYSPEPRFEKDNVFVPGTWFSEYIEKLQQLRERKAENVESFEDREKRKLIEKMLSDQYDQEFHGYVPDPELHKKKWLEEKFGKLTQIEQGAKI